MHPSPSFSGSNLQELEPFSLCSLLLIILSLLCFSFVESFCCFCLAFASIWGYIGLFFLEKTDLFPIRSLISARTLFVAVYIHWMDTR